MPEVLEASGTALELSVLVGRVGAALGFVLTLGLALVPVAVLLTLAAVAAWQRRRRCPRRW